MILILIRRLFVSEVLELLLRILLLLLLLVLDGLAGSLMYLLLGVFNGILVFCLGLSLHLGLDRCRLVLRLVMVLVAVLGLLAVVAVLLMKLLALLRSRFLLLGLFIVLLLVSVSLLGLLLLLFDVAGIAPRMCLDDLRLLLHLIEVLVNLLADVRDWLTVGFLRLLQSALDLLGSFGKILGLLLEMLLHLFGLALLLQLFGHLLLDNSLLGGSFDLLVALGLTHWLLLLNRLHFGNLFGLVLLLLYLVVHSVGGLVLDFLDHLRSLLHDVLQLVALLDDLLDLVLDEALEVLLLSVVLDGLGLDLQLIVDVSDLILDLIISNGLLVVLMVALVLPRLLDELLDDRLDIGRFVGLNQVFMVMMPLLMMHC